MLLVCELSIEGRAVAISLGMLAVCEFRGASCSDLFRDAGCMHFDFMEGEP